MYARMYVFMYVLCMYVYYTTINLNNTLE